MHNIMCLLTPTLARRRFDVGSPESFSFLSGWIASNSFAFCRAIYKWILNFKLNFILPNRKKLGTSKTSWGKWTNSATWRPNDWSHEPGWTRYNNVKVLSPVKAVTWRLSTAGTSSAKAVSSWKWVANNAHGWIFTAMCLMNGKRKMWSNLITTDEKKR